MKTKETNLWKWLSQAREKYAGGLHMQRVENAVAVGVPDVEGCLYGRSFWIELKTAAANKKGIVRVKITVDQVQWLKRRCRADGRALVLLQVDNDKFLLNGADAGYLLQPISMLNLSSLCILTNSSTEPPWTPNNVVEMAAGLL